MLKTAIAIAIHSPQTVLSPHCHKHSFGLVVTQARYAAYISQQPNAANDYTLIIDFNDGPPGGADWYEVELVQGGTSLPAGEHFGTEGIAHSNSCNAFGWAQDPDDPTRPVQVRIFADDDDNEVASGETSEQGFSFNLWGY